MLALSLNSLSAMALQSELARIGKVVDGKTTAGAARSA
jgi:hypothetical protein